MSDYKAILPAFSYNRIVFLDAPHVLSPADLAETFNTPAELGASDAADPDPAMQPRGWWKVDRTRTKLTGIEASFDLLRDTLKKDHYVVCVTFYRLVDKLNPRRESSALVKGQRWRRCWLH